MRRLALLVCLLFSLNTPVSARIETHDFANAEQEALYFKLVQELRCVVCQNQNLADSNAELAIDLRNKTAAMVNQGKSRNEVVAFMVERYGDFVLYKPPFNAATLLLWLSPLFLLILAGLTVFIIFRKRPPQTLGAQQLNTAKHLLNDDEDTPS